MSGLIFAVQAQPQTDLTIRVFPGLARVQVEGSVRPRTVWSFRDSYAGVVGLGNRVENLEAFDEKGSRVEIRRNAPGQFQSASLANKFKYDVNVAPPARSSDAALVSWLNSERGVLMLGDLLPILDSSARVKVRIDLPSGWTSGSAENKSSQNGFEFSDSDRAVVAVGKNLRVSSRTNAGASFVLAGDGEWAFKDDDAVDLTAKITKMHSDVAGPLPCNQTALFILPFPSATSADRWSAQTRGCSVLLLMGKHPSRVGALSQLGNALTHELFHLWIPNGLSLQGDYDWFYEGFTVYHAARTAVRMDLLTFAEFLTAMGRAFDGFSSAPDLNSMSLVEASKRRWTTGTSGVYSKAMLVAFLYDLNLRSQSKGKRSLDDVYRNIFRSQKTGAQSSSQKSANGNEVVISALSAESGGSDFVQRFINQPVSVDLQQELSQFGLRVEKFGFRTRIVPVEKLTKRQRDLLRELGYNDRAR